MFFIIVAIALLSLITVLFLREGTGRGRYITVCVAASMVLLVVGYAQWLLREATLSPDALPFIILLYAGLLGLIAWSAYRASAGHEKDAITLDVQARELIKQTTQGLTYMTPPVDDNNALAPARWDEQMIVRQLQNLSQRPASIPHYIESLKERFIIRQEYRTAQERIQFLKTILEQLNTAKALQLALDDLQFHALEREVKRLGLEQQRQNLTTQQATQLELDKLRAEKEALALRLEITRLQRQIREEENPSSPPPKPSPEEERVQQRTRLEAELERLRQAKAEAEAKATSDEEKIKIANMYDDQLDRVMQDLRKYL